MQRPPGSTLTLRALALKCPRCGGEKMFTGLFHMNERCGHCGLKYEREPGYFLGSIYINYGMTAMITAATYISLRFGLGIESRGLVWGLLAFCIAFPVFFFRYARALWISMDCRFDATLFPPDEPEPRVP